MKNTKKLFALLLSAALLLTFAACGKSSDSTRVKNPKSVSINGIDISLDKTGDYEGKISYITSSDFLSKYSTLSGMIYCIPEDGGDTVYSLYNKFEFTVSSHSYDSWEQTLASIERQPEIFKDVSIEEKTYNDTAWTYVTFVKHITDPDNGTEMDVNYHQFFLEREFNGETELVQVSMYRADDIEAFQEEFMNSVTFLK